jgi:hypothetical protein
MKTISTFKKMALVCAVGLMAFSLNAQNIITIDNNPGSTTTYQTIQEAHDNANAGDTIYVQPSGTTYGSVNIRKSLTIIGRSHSETGKISQLSGVNQGANNITLRGLVFSSFFYDTGSPEPALRENLEITNCRIFSTFQLGGGNSRPTNNSIIRGNLLQGISISTTSTNNLIRNNILGGLSSSNNQSTLIANNVFRTTNNISITNGDPNFPMILANNMFIFNSNTDRNVNFSGGNAFGLSNNLTYNYGAGNVILNPGNASAFTSTFALENTDPLFVNVDSSGGASLAGLSTYSPISVPNEDLRLQAGSPALTGGSGGTEMGLYYNYNYNPLGQPTGYPTLDVESYDVVAPTNGNINVTITGKAY